MKPVLDWFSRRLTAAWFTGNALSHRAGYDMQDVTFTL